MKSKEKRLLTAGALLISAFASWTLMVKTVDVKPAGPGGSEVGFAGLNFSFHQMTGVHMSLYNVTDWLGLVPVFVCMVFCVIGITQLVGRRSLLKVDKDILLLGAYYMLVIAGYLLFEMYPVNYRPVLINGYLEASYPSSTTLLVLSVMPTLAFQAGRRLPGSVSANTIRVLTVVFTVFMIAGRLISGVHWLTDIAGAVLLSAGLYLIYKAAVLICDRMEGHNGIS